MSNNPTRGAEQVAKRIGVTCITHESYNEANPYSPCKVVFHESEAAALIQAAIDEAVGEYRQILGWLVADIRNTAKEQKIKGAELYRNPCYGTGLHAWEKATELLGLAANAPKEEKR